MAGYLYFGDSGVSLNTTQSRLLGELMRPAIQKVSTEVMEKVYFSYDLYDNTLNFSELTPEEYMNCYNQLKNLFEVDLIGKKDKDGESYQNTIDFWYEEIKVKMKESPLFIGRSAN